MELTDTNSPRACSYKGATRPLCGSRDTVGNLETRKSFGPIHLHSVSVTIAKGKHPAPFRTWKLSLSTPMVLRGGPRGRLGRRRTYIYNPGLVPGLYVFNRICLGVRIDFPITSNVRIHRFVALVVICWGVSCARRGVCDKIESMSESHENSGADCGRRPSGPSRNQRNFRAGGKARRSGAFGDAKPAQRQYSGGNVRSRRQDSDRARNDSDQSSSAASKSARQQRTPQGFAGEREQGRDPRPISEQPRHSRTGSSSRSNPKTRKTFGSQKMGDLSSRRPRRPHSEPKLLNPGLEKPVDEPDAPTQFDQASFTKPLKAELRSLPRELANQVFGHIWAIGEYFDSDPELAHRHGKAARRKAGRLPLVREAAAEAAYNAGDYADALTEYRAVHRMTGNPNFLVVLADCERGTGRPEAALRTLAKIDDAAIFPEQRVEKILVEAGARTDLSQFAEAARVLKTAISNVKDVPDEAKARLRYAYAEMLYQAGHVEDAEKWFLVADRLDKSHSLGADARVAEIRGVELESEPDDDFKYEFIDVDPEALAAEPSQRLDHQEHRGDQGGEGSSEMAEDTETPGVGDDEAAEEDVTGDSGHGVQAD